MKHSNMESSPQTQSIGDSFIQNQPAVIVRQLKEWVEIIVDWETKNQYEVLTEMGSRLGIIVERADGAFSFVKRMLFRSHRPFEIDIFDNFHKPVLHLQRHFFFFFSDLYVTTPDGRRVGSIHRRFGILNKKYELIDSMGRVFARIQSPVWRLWTFPIYNYYGVPGGVITKKWQGFLKEMFTDADQFYVEFSQAPWTSSQKALILAASISIDFDFFEDNQGSNQSIGERF